uniref:DUF834 domain-containing protein n=1 Tax=Syphacia muris TaxID=451379 RepID=A0A0N5ADJ7_9BILA
MLQQLRCWCMKVKIDKSVWPIVYNAAQSTRTVCECVTGERIDEGNSYTSCIKGEGGVCALKKQFILDNVGGKDVLDVKKMGFLLEKYENCTVGKKESMDGSEWSAWLEFFSAIDDDNDNNVVGVGDSVTDNNDGDDDDIDQ